MDVLVGASEIDITPSAGLPMDGYLARGNATSQGAHDPLRAQVLVLDNGKLRLVLVTLDVLAVGGAFTRNLQQAISGLAATDPASVMVCASHTHAGPAGLQDWFPMGAFPRTTAELASEIQSRLLNAAQNALARLRPVTFSFAAGPVAGIGMDRNQPLPAADPLVTVLRFDKPDGAPAAAIFHYACHPTVLGPQLLYSADFPGAARDRIRREYPSTICLYLNGAAGNISTRFTRQSQTFEEVERLGNLLGDHAVKLLRKSEPSLLNLGSSQVVIDLPLRAFTTAPRTIQATGHQRIDQTRAEGALLEGQLARAFAGRQWQRATLHAFQFGPLWLLGVPGEPFNELSARVRQASPFALVVGYTDDYVGYFPTQKAIDDATYEALSSPYDARALDLIATALLGWIP